jgi:hypothetical protein
VPSTIDVITAADSRYNGLQVVLNKRVGHGLEFQTSYTYSKVLDDTQGQANVADCFTSFGLQGVDPRHTFVDRGPACFDSTHNWEFSMLYHLPTIQSENGLLSKMANGWWIASIASKQSGYPVSPIAFVNRSNSGVLQGQSDRVDLNTPALLAAYPCTSQPGQPAAGSNPCAYTPIPFNKNTVVTGDIHQWFNPAMFSMAPEFASPPSEQASCPPGSAPCNFIGQLGTAGRDILRGPGSSDWDFSLVKDTKVKFLGEAGSVQSVPNSSMS